MSGELLPVGMFYSIWIRQLTQSFAPLYDFMFPIKVMGQAQPYEPVQIGVSLQDVCYPALAMVWEWMFPLNDLGGLLCTSVGLALYLFGFLAVLERFGITRRWLCLLFVGFSAPVVFSHYVGNLILYAAGALNLYFAWYDSESRGKRILAAIMLAIAGALKITPCLAGLLYLRKRSRRSYALAVLAALVFLILLFVPFCFCGGREGFFLWMRNAAANSTVYAHLNSIGVYGLIGEIADVFGYRYEVMMAIGPLARGGSVVFAVCCLWRVVSARFTEEWAIASVCLGMMFLPPTMMFYVTLYILPVLIVLATRGKGKASKVGKWGIVAICLPVKIPLLLGTVNGLFSAACLVDLALLIVLGRYDVADASAGSS